MAVVRAAPPPAAVSPLRPAAVCLPRRALLGTAARLPLAGLAGGLALAGCAAPVVQPAGGRALPEPRIRVGDRWIYREINLYNGSEVARIEETVTAVGPAGAAGSAGAAAGPAIAVGTRILPSEFSAGRVQRPDAVDTGRFGGRWEVGRELIYDQPLDFSAPMPLLPTRLLAGQRRNDRTTYTIAGYGGRFGWRQRLTSLGVAAVDTPAGRFEALRVRREIDLDLPDPFRFDGSRRDELYYAVEVNRWVRREWTGQYRHEAHLGGLDSFLREDWVRRDLVDYQPAS